MTSTKPGALAGKRALVTGASSGLGAHFAVLLAAHGAEVVIAARRMDSLADVARRVEAHGVARCLRLDVTDAASRQELAAAAGPIDILVNAAGWVHHGTVLDTSEADWDRSFDLNVKSMHRTIRAFLPGMLEKGSGSIVNIASGASSVRGVLNRYAYGASKAAVIGLTKSVAIDYIRRGVRSNAICPGTIQSPSLDDRIKALAASTGQSEADARKAFIDRQPIGRLGTAEEVAMLAVYLASDEAAYTTGAIHIVDGGFSL